MTVKKSEIKIYTDGAAKGNPGSAGWGAVFLICEGQNAHERTLGRSDGDGQRKFSAENFRGESGGTLPGVIEIGGFVAHATNNIMELTAPIEALKYIKSKMSKAVFDIEIVSDSKYVILGITEWIENWMKNNWRNAAKKPVMNRELWEELYKLAEELKPKWTYVKGHNENKYNERADEIATSFAEGAPVGLKKYK